MKPDLDKQLWKATVEIGTLGWSGVEVEPETRVALHTAAKSLVHCSSCSPYWHLLQKLACLAWLFSHKHKGPNMKNAMSCRTN
jgi:hypothetical protein